ncbi:hypothetical protein [Rhizobium ruizarguesonis]|uniref:hypothetical protein n=1 Tax=Rhizobium ruizarguesonis TaxID=2081791 RepID=UPI003857A285
MIHHLSPSPYPARNRSPISDRTRAPSDVYDAIIEEIGNLRAAYERDPDPAEDHPEAESDEPSNDWPGASR